MESVNIEKRHPTFQESIDPPTDRPTDRPTEAKNDGKRNTRNNRQPTLLCNTTSFCYLCFIRLNRINGREEKKHIFYTHIVYCVHSQHNRRIHWCCVNKMMRCVENHQKCHFAVFMFIFSISTVFMCALCVCVIFLLSSLSFHHSYNMMMVVAIPTPCTQTKVYFRFVSGSIFTVIYMLRELLQQCCKP